VPFTLDDLEKYRTEDKLKIQRILKLNTNQETTKYSKTKHPVLVARKRGGLILQRSHGALTGEVINTDRRQIIN